MQTFIAACLVLCIGVIFQTPAFAQTGNTGAGDESTGEPPGGSLIPTHTGPIGRVDERIDDPECDTCFTVPGLDGGRHQIFESLAVDGREVIIRRDIPNPSPLAEGETRLTYDAESGEDIWYIGDQAFVGPTDEDTFSDLHTKTKIEMIRLKTKKEPDIFGVRGVHGFAVNETGFTVYLLPEYRANERLISRTIEGLPVTVKTAALSRLAHHQNTYHRPVPTGAGISSQWWRGTLGMHVVRNAGGCCTIWTLASAHVVLHHPDDTPPAPGVRRMFQPTVSNYNHFGYVAKSFNLQPCGTIAQCQQNSAYVNYATQRPDVAAIDPLVYGEADTYPHTPEGNDVVRRLQYSSSSYHNGPSGMIMTARKKHKHKIWGSVTAGTKTGKVKEIAAAVIVTGDGTDHYKVCCLNLVDLWVNPGDSGSAVTYAGTSNRHVAGLLMAQKHDDNGNPEKGGWYIRAADIKTAFENADVDFHHYWGTKEGYREPSEDQCDPPGC